MSAIRNLGTPSVHRCCQVCTSERFEHLHHNRFAPLDGVDLSTQIGTCLDCGHLQSFRLPDIEHYQRYYQNLSKTDYDKGLSELDTARINTSVKLARQYSVRGMTVADIGCGGGALLAELQKAGLTPVLGLDPGIGASVHAKERYGLDVVEQGFMSAAAVRVTQTEPDLVFLMAVIEHLFDARNDIQALVRAMKPGANLIVEVPAIEESDNEWGEPLGEFSLEHIQFFSGSTLQRLMNGLGLLTLQWERVQWPNRIGNSWVAVFQRPSQIEDRDHSPWPVATDRELRRAAARYVRNGTRRLSQAMECIPAEGSLVLYGAGAHTARLLPMMPSSIVDRVQAVVDSNPNLHGKRLGRYVIQPPEVLPTLPEASVVLSSFRCQEELALRVLAEWKRKAVRLYPQLQKMPTNSPLLPAICGHE